MSGSTHRDTALPSPIAVFVDLPEGELDDAGKGILSEASRLARTRGCGWSVICFAGAGRDALEGLTPYGAGPVTVIEGPAGVADDPALQARLIARVATERGAGVLLLAHNDLGATLAPVLAAELCGALFTEAIAYAREGSDLLVTRQILGAQVAETKAWTGNRPLVMTVSPKTLSAVVLPTMQRGTLQVDQWRPAAAPAPGATRIVERIPPDPQTVDVAEAEVIVSAGLGCNETAFAQVRELARLLNASLGVTRPVYDLGYAGFERMVGQTGKTVAPRLYLALGISGSMHHIGGIKDAKRIISLNIDAKVPIFPNSDEGFVADLREVLPLLIERVRAASGGAA
jgi:electron transfer flavoprotein alpha subunit